MGFIELVIDIVRITLFAMFVSAVAAVTMAAIYWTFQGVVWLVGWVGDWVYDLLEAREKALKDLHD